MSTATETTYEPIGVHGQPPAHRPCNRPAGYVDARCVRCKADLFVPPGTEAPHCDKCSPPAPAHQSSEDKLGLAYLHHRLGKVAFVEFIQTRRYLHFASGISATNRYVEEWGCCLNVKNGGSFHLANGTTASGAAERAVEKYMEEQAALTEAAEKEMYDAEHEGERFDGGPL